MPSAIIPIDNYADKRGSTVVIKQSDHFVRGMTSNGEILMTICAVVHRCEWRDIRSLETS